ncbi:hypothetical protein [Rathayibacter tanaceti]|uniref:Uncharacterized protein n=2 Tax=Rathayibacter tanaceti TaxID=1671680 RepID=A0A162GF95_9MICO|nr:hypothetical protein [Rathayibacter tanaceti]KZX20229.1 hypothetical protein ACH61_02658 [Rathayibacter tanaceti]QHC56539.1 hypothetical protein GSU10_13475 [Rathayibacter tanaceti]TCO36753.1 hypothetical protein EV639_106156 [Rathayibacter tanaceti]
MSLPVSIPALVPGTGTALPWVSAVLHGARPALSLLDWVLLTDGAPLSWRRLRVVLPYPLLWIVVVLTRRGRRTAAFCFVWARSRRR